jgi:ribosomal protein L20
MGIHSPFPERYIMKKSNSQYKMPKETKRLLMGMSGDHKSNYRQATIQAELQPKLDFMFRDKKKNKGDSKNEE